MIHVKLLKAAISIKTCNITFNIANYSLKIRFKNNNKEFKKKHAKN